MFLMTTLLIKIQNLDHQWLYRCHLPWSKVNQDNFLSSRVGENLPDVIEARKGEILISYRASPSSDESGKFQPVTSQWKSAPNNFPFLVRFGNSMNTPSFRTLCGEWLNYVATVIPESTYERKGNYAILMATLELLGNLHGDWTREDCQIHMKSYVSQEGILTQKYWGRWL